MNLRHISLFCVFLMLLDAGSYFYQQYQFPIDGDLSRVVLPSEGCKPVLSDPLGISVWQTGEGYVSPNRWGCHAMMYGFFRTVPFVFQAFFSPIDSIYLSAALLKLLIHLGIVWSLGLYISKGLGWKMDKLGMAMVLVFPFLQGVGYHGTMGVVDQAVTYASFYAFPLMLLMWFFYPLYAWCKDGMKTRWSSFSYGAMILAALYLSLSGPLVGPVVIILTAMIFFFFGSKGMKEYAWSFKGFLPSMRNIPKPFFLILGLFCLFACYSLILGGYNIEGANPSVGLWDRFALLPTGLYKLFTTKIGLPILLAISMIYCGWLLRIGNEQDRKKLKNTLIWIGVFTLFFTLLLPFGGYRVYRPYIIRRDTFAPVLFALFYVYGLSAGMLMMHVKGRGKWILAGLTVAVFLLFSISDWQFPSRNTCERSSLQKMADASLIPVPLDENCPVLGWTTFHEFGESQVQAELLHVWGVTDTIKVYHFLPEN
ncbi:MAG: hypothetical protein AAFY71_00735 [Bacteroidota bacterium]